MKKKINNNLNTICFVFFFLVKFLLNLMKIHKEEFKEFSYTLIYNLEKA